MVGKDPQILHWVHMCPDGQNFRAPTNVCDCRGVPPVRGGGAAGEVQRVRVPGVARPPEPAPAPQSQGHTECAR